tara:strand:- start:359 stop:544 length:186 start_codon:yes stop_codon:yes gene_type:complete
VGLKLVTGGTKPVVDVILPFKISVVDRGLVVVFKGLVVAFDTDDDLPLFELAPYAIIHLLL